MKLWSCTWWLLVATALPAQQVWLQGGEVLPGSVVAVKDNRAQIRGPDGALRQLPVRQVDREVAADGQVRRFPAEAHAGELAAAERALLDQVARGAELAVPELIAATEGLGIRASVVVNECRPSTATAMSV